jgi:hypothetical protein
MKQKMLYIFLAALMIIIIVSLLLSIENTKVRSVSKPDQQEIIPQEESAPFEETQQFSPADHTIKPAITIINPRPNQNENPAVIPAEPNKPGASQASVETGQGSSSPEGETQQKHASGITRIGKYPAEEQKHEMETRGTIMF